VQEGAWGEGGRTRQDYGGRKRAHGKEDEQLGDSLYSNFSTKENWPFKREEFWADPQVMTLEEGRADKERETVKKQWERKGYN